MNAYDNSILWHEKFVHKFYSICSQYNDVILFHLTAHFHTDDFRLFGSTAILLNPSISPDHYNNPSFRKYVVEDNTVVNYEQYYTDLTISNQHYVCYFS